MGFLDSLHRVNVDHDPADNFDRTNIDSGVFQARQAISEALSQENPFLQNAEFSAIALWVSAPTLFPPISDVVNAAVPLDPSSGPFVTIPKMMIKIYFRVPVLHANLPLPPAFSPSSATAISKLKPEEQNILLISCHPHLYADFDSFSGITAGDQIKIRFDDKTYSSAKIVKTEKKSTNSIVPIVSDYVTAAKELFDDAAEALLLGTPSDKKYTNVIYELEDKLGTVDQIIETTGWPLISSAVEVEYKRWKYGALKETNSGAYTYLKEYWDNIGVAEWSPSGTPWSAAFISFVLKSSGFPGSSSHRSYTRKIIEKDTPWTAYSISKNKGKIKVGLGDVVVAARGGGTEEDYDKTHGDVVYKIEEAGSGFKALTAGGNLGNTAKDGTPLMLDGDYNLLNAGKYVVILKYGNLKNAA